MLRSPVARYALGVSLGALAGASLCLSVLPMGLQMAGYGSRLALGYYLSRYIPFAALVMAAGGWGVVRSRHPLAAMAVFSLAGLGTGLMLTGVALERAPRLMAAGAAAGWVYGLLGGLVLGRILAPPVVDEEPAAAVTGNADEAVNADGAGSEPADAADPEQRDYF
ncbi:MAG: hypothetical protein IPJ24_02195 [bacterium]|nr:hypothetical protein [bacterium]